MKILLVHNRYLHPGGEDRVVEMELQMLKKYGHEVDLYEEFNSDIERIGKIETGLRCIWSKESFKKVSKLLNSQKYDIMHVHNFFPLISPAIYYAAQQTNIPVVQTLHNYRLLCSNALFYRDGHPCTDCLNHALPLPGVIHKCYQDSYLASTILSSMITTHRLLRTWLQKVDRYITLSHFQYNKFIEAGFPQDKLIVKGNFVHPDPGIGNGQDNYVLFAGRLSKEKGIETLLAGWKQFIGNQINLVIVGNGPLQSLVEKSCKDLPSIKYLGFLNPNQTIELMGNAQIVIVPSEWYETFGLVAIEAFARGTPVVASSIGALKEIVTNKHTGLLFQPGNPQDMTSKILQLWNQFDLLRSMRLAARQEYCLKYTQANNYSQLINIYNSVCQNYKANN